jgi:hypothetical protein
MEIKLDAFSNSALFGNDDMLALYLTEIQSENIEYFSLECCRYNQILDF